MSRPYAEVIGDPIAQSKSPLIHLHWLEKAGIDADYRSCRVAVEDLASYLAERRADPAWRGCNVTMPHKLAVMEHLDAIEEPARSIGAANTIYPASDGTLRGTNTDAPGFLEPLRPLLDRQHLFRMARILGTGDVWDELEDVLSQTWQHESGAMLPITAAAVDTGGTGGNTQSAYDWLRGKTGRRIFAVKGQGGWGKPIAAAPNRKRSGKNPRKVDLFLVGADEVKLTVMRRLAVEKPGPGYCHFPEGREAEYFAQLTAEKLVTRYVKGFPVREWHKTRPRNEALDCRAYALAALKIANPSLRGAAERIARATVGTMPPPPPVNDNPPAPEPAKRAAPETHGGKPRQPSKANP